MRVAQLVSTRRGSWEHSPTGTNLEDARDAQLALLFAVPEAITPDMLGDVRARFPRAFICGCSTAGEIAAGRVTDNAVVVTAVAFDSVTVKSATVAIPTPEDSYGAGRALVEALPAAGLAHVFLLCDGLKVNGTELARGVNEMLPPHVRATGGLSGDSGRFQETYVVVDGRAVSRHAVIVGLYGDALQVGHGSLGGWEAFGPERRVTRARGNVLYELDGRSALALYKEYLGDYAAELPASGLLFPLSVRDGDPSRALTRTILGIDEAEQSLTFAGDVPEGTLARLMHSTFDGLVEGAAAAARQCLEVTSRGGRDGAQTLAILVSCVGRKIVLKQRIEEEIDAVLDVLGPRTLTTGFYSYGELAPLGALSPCSLHNQTMTITTIGEV